MSDPELEQLLARRPRWEPTAATEARHRQELMAAIAASSPANRHRRHSRRMPVLLAACAVVVTAGVMFAVLNSDRQGRVSTIAPAVSIPSSSEQSSTTVLTSRLQCGDALPFALDLPSRFGFVVMGPAPDSESRPREEQLVQHWVTDASAIEVRWPVDVAVQRQIDTNQQRGGSDNGMLGVNWGGTTAAGRAWKLIAPRTSVDNIPGCETVQLTVYEDTVDKAWDASLALLQVFNRSLRPLISEVRTVDALPGVVPCAAPDNVPHVATKQAPVSMPPQTSPREALRYFRRELAPRGQPGSDFIELILPEGAVGYASALQTGQASSSPDKYVLVLSLEQSADGWRVNSWRSSGC
jgi:hypothetical protein